LPDALRLGLSLKAWKKQIDQRDKDDKNKKKHRGSSFPYFDD
jgi:hypothetical protein